MFVKYSVQINGASLILSPVSPELVSLFYRGAERSLDTVRRLGITSVQASGMCHFGES